MKNPLPRDPAHDLPGNLQNTSWDVIVYGATPGGIGAALGASRRGLKTLLLEASDHFGGLMTSGLGKSDIENPETCGALFREFSGRILDHYTSTYGSDSEQVSMCRNGVCFEPSVASRVLRTMVKNEPCLETRFHSPLTSVTKSGAALCAVTCADESGRSRSYEGRCFVDATYEGDLAALAGASYRLGRESRDEWNEEFAGKIYMVFDQTKEVLPGSTGEGDGLIQAYNYRLCLTKIAANRAPVSKPAEYNRNDYVSLIEDARAGRVKQLDDVIQANRLIPNGKSDTNHHHFALCSTDLAEENGSYPEGTPEVRKKFARRLRSYTEGLLWFLQNDGELPDFLKNEAREWGYAKDEFVDNGHFPPALYVREARRVEGGYTFTENDARLAPGLGRTPIQSDSIAVGEYQIDSHSTRKREAAGQNKAVEGFIGLRWLTRPYQIPYGVIVPNHVEGLLVPVAVSATHLGFGTLRMEPIWMQLGFAAGIACDLALKHRWQFRDIPMPALQVELLASNQRISFFSDVPWEHPARKAAEYFATKGFFETYLARLDEAVTVNEASRWIAHVRSLEGIRALPSLPASNECLPAGVDMGPRFPKQEPAPADYWTSNPLLGKPMAERWLLTVRRIFKEENGFAFSQPVTRGEWCQVLYSLVRNAHFSKTPAASGQ